MIYFAGKSRNGLVADTDLVDVADTGEGATVR